FRLPSTSRLSFNKRLNVRIRIYSNRSIFRQTSRVNRRSIHTVDFPSQHSKQNPLLSPVMCSMCYSSQHNPSPCSCDVKKGHLNFPPGFILFFKSGEPLSTIFSIPLYKFDTCFRFRQGRRSYINTEHIAKPLVFTQTLMHHVFEGISVSLVQRMRAN